MLISVDKELEANKLKNQKGQSLVEFVLLLAIVMVISMGFLKVINTNVADYWQAMAQMLVEDETQQLELR